MRYLFLILILLSAYKSFSQDPFPIKQKLGTNKTLVISNGGFIADSGFAVSLRDTLNHPLNYYNGGLTFWQNNLWMRTTEGWKNISTSIDTIGISKVLAGYGLYSVNDSTLRVDTSVIVYKTFLSSELALKLNVSDTNVFVRKVNYNTFRDSVATALNLKLNKADTAGLARRTELAIKVTKGGDAGAFSVGTTDNTDFTLIRNNQTYTTLNSAGVNTGTREFFTPKINNSTATATGIDFGNGAHNIGFRTQGATRMYISTTGVGIGTITPNSNADLDLGSTNKYLLPNRLTTTQRDLIVSPSRGAFIYNVTDSVFQYWDNSWRPILNTTQGWMIGGNNTENPLLGTNNNRKLRLVTNGVQRLVLDSAVARLNIGVSTGTSELVVRTLNSHENNSNIVLNSGSISYQASQSGGGGSHIFGGSNGVLLANVRMSVNARHRNNNNILTNNFKSISNTSDVDVFTLKYDSVFGYYYKPGTSTSSENVGYHAAFVSERGYVGINTLAPDTTTVIDIRTNAENKGGIGLPEMTTAIRTSYTPTRTQVVFDTTLNKICLYIVGVGWVGITTESL
ncbi:hypothetical protein [Polluticaenibacter yanchengensis]|uniref:Uncharacterized protein n=1 Tax=Polluticaenibacter yanchengensis TaxID=3014562 RepID=A0ABT4UIV0_9BACT|nr:hypothetical protein [Chitinophagaceae bacterium LY-5]